MEASAAAVRPARQGMTGEARVAKGLSGAELTKLARIGAASRLAELEREIAALRKAFPGLRAASAAAPSGTPPPAAPAKTGAPVSRRGRRKPMSAAERRAVSDRMKKYWADRRKSKG